MNIDDKELERNIENAFRARGLKEAMRQWDIDAKGERRGCEEASEPKITSWQKIRRKVYAVSAVAAVAAILVIIVPASTWQTTYRQLTRWGYQQYAHYFLKPQQKQSVVYQHTIEELMAMAEPSIKDIADNYYEQDILGHENPMHEATWQILIGNYAVAQSILEDVNETLNTNDKYYQNTMEDIAYLDALCYLGQNHRTKAIKLLNNIAKSNSRHSQRATWLVEEIK
jgi:hypothetical protein